MIKVNITLCHSAVTFVTKRKGQKLISHTLTRHTSLNSAISVMFYSEKTRVVISSPVNFRLWCHGFFLYFLFYFEGLFPSMSRLFLLPLRFPLCWLPAPLWFPSPVSRYASVLKSCDCLCLGRFISVFTACHVLAIKPVFVPVLNLRS